MVASNSEDVDIKTPDKKISAIEEKKESKTLFFKLRSHFRSYCNHTSIHGFQYFGQHRTKIERVWWFLVFIFIISGCGYTIFLIYRKWQKSPVIVSLTTKDTPIYQVPFPTVTICPTIKFSQENINLRKLYDELINSGEISDTADIRKFLTEDENELLEYLLPLCKPATAWGFGVFIDPQTNITKRIYDKLLKCSPFMKHSKHKTQFMEEPLKFKDAFKPILTEDGLCFTFNMLSSNDIYQDDVYVHPGFNTSGPKSFWIPQRGYSRDAGLLTYPRRAILSGPTYSLELKISHEKEDIDYICTGAEQGYKVILHHPTRLARPTVEYLLAPFSKATMISVNPHMMTTSSVVKSYAPDKRDCYFPEEKQLRYFKIYSMSNCQTECLTNYTLIECGCVPFYMPREAETPICGFKKAECVLMARKKFNLSKLKEKLAELYNNQPQMPTLKTSLKSNVLMKKTVEKRTAPSAEKKKRSLGGKDEEEDDDDEDMGNGVDEDQTSARCFCLRNCHDITYVGTATSVDYFWRKESLDNVTNSSNIDYTQIIVYLDTNVLITTQRNELYGPTDFLSNFGGLLGLFTGFSILSLIEIIYFWSLRVFGNISILGRWYGDENE